MVRVIEDIRRDIDAVDQELLRLIAKRLDLAGEVRRAKSGSQVWRPSREASLLRRLAEVAPDTSPKLLSAIWAELVSASLVSQGPIRLHVSLEGDAVSVSKLVRDRFGDAIPISSYPTASAALAACAGVPEAVAIVTAPGGMNTWWTALHTGGALSHLHILSGLPRVGARDWPAAVAVSAAAIEPSGQDTTLISVSPGQSGIKTPEKVAASAGVSMSLRARHGHLDLYEVSGFFDHAAAGYDALSKAFPDIKIIGVLPVSLPLDESRS